MPIIAKDTGGTDIPPITPGSHHGVCYGVVDIGTQPGGQFEPHRKVIIIFELPHERAEFEKDGKKENKPRAISQEYTLSLGKKANLRRELENWRARPFTEEELKAFDLGKLIGANALVSVIHAAGKGKNANKVFANIKGLASLTKGTPRIPKTENEPLYFSLDDTPKGTLPEFPANMPQWIQDKIKISEEYRRIEKELGGTPSAANQASPGAAPGEEPPPF